MGFSTLLSGVSRLFGKEEVGGSNPLDSSRKNDKFRGVSLRDV